MRDLIKAIGTYLDDVCQPGRCEYLRARRISHDRMHCNAVDGGAATHSGGLGNAGSGWQRRVATVPNAPSTSGRFHRHPLLIHFLSAISRNLDHPRCRRLIYCSRALGVCHGCARPLHSTCGMQNRRVSGVRF